MTVYLLSRYDRGGVSLTRDQLLRARTYRESRRHTRSVYTRAVLSEQRDPTLEITFATYCGNSSHYDESWMAFFLLTQEIPVGPNTRLAPRREIEISSTRRRRERAPAGNLGRMDIATDVKYIGILWK